MLAQCTPAHQTAHPPSSRALLATAPATALLRGRRGGATRTAAAAAVCPPRHVSTAFVYVAFQAVRVLDPPSPFALSDHRPVNLSKCFGFLRLARSLGSLSRSPPLPASSSRQRRRRRRCRRRAAPRMVRHARRPDALAPEAPALAPDIRHVRFRHRPEQCIGGRERRLHFFLPRFKWLLYDNGVVPGQPPTSNSPAVHSHCP